MKLGLNELKILRIKQFIRSQNVMTFIITTKKKQD